MAQIKKETKMKMEKKIEKKCLPPKKQGTCLRPVTSHQSPVTQFKTERQPTTATRPINNEPRISHCLTPSNHNRCLPSPSAAANAPPQTGHLHTIENMLIKKVGHVHLWSFGKPSAALSGYFSGYGSTS
mmetsp:Transcript_26396/g.67346  ORF Transcript_26396/g.67346 Transcript_26396/m.67346 type:complete len:129 (+) Transcript_26396:187-573(+)